MNKYSDLQNRLQKDMHHMWANVKFDKPKPGQIFTIFEDGVERRFKADKQGKYQPIGESK